MEKTTRENYPQLLLESQLCFPLYAGARRIVNAYTPYLKPLGLTYTQYIVFLCLWEHGEMTVGDLCRTLFLDNGTITPLIKKMAQEGYVDRTRSRKDERVVRIGLTEKGWELRDRVRDIPAQVGSCVHLSGKDALELYRLLHALLEAQPGDDV
ncbi:MAG: MarR family transcriptional regulator [Clostridia bacterium]|nr:MarR family transcriptional regulator [Clostridia bacterium]